MPGSSWISGIPYLRVFPSVFSLSRSSDLPSLRCSRSHARTGPTACLTRGSQEQPLLDTWRIILRCALRSQGRPCTRTMKLSEFDYHLPQDRIALRPAEPRDSARLVCLRRKTGEISHHAFNEIGALLKSSDLLVLNNTKVFPARLFGQRLGLASETYSKESRPRATIEV